MHSVHWSLGASFHFFLTQWSQFCLRTSYTVSKTHGCALSPKSSCLLLALCHAVWTSDITGQYLPMHSLPSRILVETASNLLTDEGWLAIFTTWNLPKSNHGSVSQLRKNLLFFLRIMARSLPVGASTNAPWAQSLRTHPRFPEDSSWDLRTSGEWNTTSSRRQVQTPDIWAPYLQEENLPAENAVTTETQERASLPGLLIETNRIIRGTSSNQRQL